MATKKQPLIEVVKKRPLTEVVADIKAQQKKEREDNQKFEALEKESSVSPKDFFETPHDPVYGMQEFKEASDKLLKRKCCTNCEEWTPLCNAGDCSTGTPKDFSD